MATDWRPQSRRIGALPQFGTCKHGSKWFLVDMDTGAQLGGAFHNSRMECIVYAYERARTEAGEGDNPLLKNVQRKMVGHVGVDTGCIIICDPAYLADQRLAERQRELELSHLDAAQDGEAAYPQAYGINFLAGHEGAAVVTTSGIGDGFYPVYITTAEIERFGERVVRVEVDFLEHPWLTTVPLEIPSAIKQLLRDLRRWLPLVEAKDAEGLLTMVNMILGSEQEEDCTDD